MAVRARSASRSFIGAFGVALVGSHARDEARPDSDVDLILLCRDAEKLAPRTDWVVRFGAAREIRHERYGIVQSLRVFYEEGLEVEFGLSPLEWVDLPLDAGTRRVVSDGMRILYDPDGPLDAAEAAAER